MEFDCIHYKSLPGKDEVELVSAFEKTSNLAFFPDLRANHLS